MFVDALRFFTILCVAIIVGKLIAQTKLPAILGWLITGVFFGPYLVQIVSFEIMDSVWYKVVTKMFECCAGVMIGSEIIFKKIARSGKQIIGITFIQSIGTFLVVSLAFAVTFLIAKIPVYLAFVFGAIALATAPAPALSIVNEYQTKGPVTRTLIPLAAIDDVIGVIVFFTTISIIGAVEGGASVSVAATVGVVLFPFIIGISLGAAAGFLIRRIKKQEIYFFIFIVGLPLSVAAGIAVDCFVFHAFRLNYLLIGMAYSAAIANIVDENKLGNLMDAYAPILNISLVAVIVNLGLPLDYRLIAGAGGFTFIYILSRALGKIGGAYLGGKVTKAEPTVTKFLGLTLLPHSGVSLVFTGIAVGTLAPINPELVNLISGTIVAAAIINEIIAVLLAKSAFKLAKEMPAKDNGNLRQRI